MDRQSQALPDERHQNVCRLIEIKVSVTAAPVAGRATDHMVRFLAKEFGVTAKDIMVVFGRFNVNKQLRIKSPQSQPAVIGKVLAMSVLRQART